MMIGEHVLIGVTNSVRQLGFWLVQLPGGLGVFAIRAFVACAILSIMQAGTASHSSAVAYQSSAESDASLSFPKSVTIYNADPAQNSDVPVDDTLQPRLDIAKRIEPLPDTSSHHVTPDVHANLEWLEQHRNTKAAPMWLADYSGQEYLLASAHITPESGTDERGAEGDEDQSNALIPVSGACAYWLNGQMHALALKATPDDVASCLNAGADLDIRDRGGLTALHIAARYAKNPDILTRFVEAGIDVDARTVGESSKTALHIAAQYNNSVDVVARLIGLGADVNARSRSGVTPLHFAAERNPNAAVIEYLIDHGADLDALVWDDTAGCDRTVWSLANFNDTLRQTETYLRLQAYADERHAHLAGTCPRLSARDLKKLERLSERRSRKCNLWLEGSPATFFSSPTIFGVEQCLAMGVSLTVTDHNGRNPLHLASAVTDDPDIISRLVEAGADIMATVDDEVMNTVLHHAARKNPNADVVARLIDLGADVNAMNADLWQPILLAAQQNRNPDVPALLIERGAEIATTPVLVRISGIIREVTLLDIAHRNRTMRDSDWYLELEAEKERQDQAARAEKERQEQAAKAEEEATRAEKERQEQAAREKELAELEEQRKERERLAGEARSKQRKRLEEKEARIATQRQSCVPALGEVDGVGFAPNRDDIVAALNDDAASTIDSFTRAIPFLLTGEGDYPDVEEAVGFRILRDFDSWIFGGVRHASEEMAEWIEVVALFRENCLHDIADYIVTIIIVEAAYDFDAVVYWETAAYPERVHSDVARALEDVSNDILSEMSAPGYLSTFPRVIDAGFDGAGNRFVKSCVDYFNAQSELREGQSLTSVQRRAFTGMCECIHSQLAAEYYVWPGQRFGDIIAEIIDPNTVFSRRHNNIRAILGKCSMLHGQSLQ